MQGLAYKLGMTAKSWTMQNLYHARKPGRNPQHLGSYRVLGLGLNPCQGHIQEGRCEALVMVAVDVAVASVRHSLHLCDRAGLLSLWAQLKAGSCLRCKTWLRQTWANALRLACGVSESFRSWKQSLLSMSIKMGLQMVHMTLLLLIVFWTC